MKKLTKLQAFNAITKLLQIYFDIKPSADLAMMLSGMGFLTKNRTVDIAMWKIWKECLDRILHDKNLRNYNYLMPIQVFVTMGLYLESILGTQEDEHVKLIEDNARLARQRKRVDQVLWQNWLKCVDEVLAVKDSREYFYLLPKK